LAASLIVNGVPITDTDHDGLDDNWEMAHFGTLAYGPKDDPDYDGYNNAFEQVLGSNHLRLISHSMWIFHSGVPALPA